MIHTVRTDQAINNFKAFQNGRLNGFNGGESSEVSEEPPEKRSRLSFDKTDGATVEEVEETRISPGR